MLRCSANRGCTVLISSHLLVEAAQIVDEVIVLTRGKLASGQATPSGAQTSRAEPAPARRVRAAIGR